MRKLWDATLKAYGLQPKDVEAAMVYDKSSEYIEALTTGRVDFAVDCGKHPAAKWMELSSSRPMKIINVDDAHMAKIQENCSWAFPIKVPANTYKTMPEEIQTAAFAVTIDCRADLPDDFIYEVTKMVWTHKKEFDQYHVACKAFSTAAVGRTNFAYHPGAIKYYKEIGVWTAKEDARQKGLLAEIGEKR